MNSKSNNNEIQQYENPGFACANPVQRLFDKQPE
jgi:hypothetical protein